MQRDSKPLDYVKCSKCPRLAITHALNLKHPPINRLMDDRPSVNQTLP